MREDTGRRGTHVPRGAQAAALAVAVLARRGPRRDLRESGPRREQLVEVLAEVLAR